MDDITNIAAVIIVFVTCLCVVFCVGMALTLLTGYFVVSVRAFFDKMLRKMGW